MQKVFTAASVKALQNLVSKEEISYSRFVEMLNEMANEKLNPTHGHIPQLTISPHSPEYIGDSLCRQRVYTDNWGLFADVFAPTSTQAENAAKYIVNAKLMHDTLVKIDEYLKIVTSNEDAFLKIQLSKINHIL